MTVGYGDMIGTNRMTSYITKALKTFATDSSTLSIFFLSPQSDFLDNSSLGVIDGTPKLSNRVLLETTGDGGALFFSTPSPQEVMEAISPRSRFGVDGLLPPYGVRTRNLGVLV